MSPRTPEDVDRLFDEHLNAGDLDALVALYEPGATLIPAPGESATGPDAIRQAFVGFLAMKPKIRMNVVQVLRAGDDLAMLFNDWTMSGTGPDGTAMNMAGKAIEIVRRQRDGSWRFAIDHPFARD